MHAKFFRIILAIFLAGLSVSACKEAAETAIPRLTKELQSSETSTKNNAALSLAAYGETAKPAVPALIKCLHDQNTGVRSAAAYALREIGTKEAEEALDNYKP